MPKNNQAIAAEIVDAIELVNETAGQAAVEAARLERLITEVLDVKDAEVARLRGHLQDIAQVAETQAEKTYGATGRMFGYFVRKSHLALGDIDDPK